MFPSLQSLTASLGLGGDMASAHADAFTDLSNDSFSQGGQNIVKIDGSSFLIPAVGVTGAILLFLYVRGRK